MTVRLLVSVVLVAAIAACSSDEPTPDSVADARFSIESDNNVSTTIETFDELRDELPFEFVDPELPDGASFTWLAVRLPPASVDEDARERITRLEMFVAGADGTGLLQLQASRMGTTPGGLGTTTVSVGSGEGIYQGNWDTAALGWRSCDVGYLISYDPELLSDEEALAIAVSIDDRCG